MCKWKCFDEQNRKNSELNSTIGKKKRNIRLFLDNAPCHPPDLKFSNVKLQFFPPNLTSKAQPLDQGVIHSFKCHYRTHLVKHLIASCTAAETANDITVTALDVVRWIDLVWNAVSQITIKNTFGAAGFKDDDKAQEHSDGGHSTSQTAATTRTNMIEDPEISRAMQMLDSLLTHIAVDGERMTAEQFSEIDEKIPTFNEWYDHHENVA